MKTIVALATPPMNAAIHIIRVSGSSTFTIINAIVSTKIQKKGYIIQKTNIVENKKMLDSVLINTFVSPKSFTGEDLVEINTHGNYFLAQKIIKLLIRHGCVMALPGEFLQRAFMNKKVTLHEAEAINNLINASGDKSIELANLGMSKETIEQLNKIHLDLFKLIGQVEVNIDYPEFDDVPQISIHLMQKMIKVLLSKIQRILFISNKILPILAGVNVVIIGKPNVGKSSLLNAILKEERVIVSKQPGTTRDAISAKINLNGITVNFIDTAGIRNAKSWIETQGILKTKEYVNQADLILWVVDNSEQLNKQDFIIKEMLKDKKYLIVINKTDLKSKINISGIKISAKKQQINNLLNAIYKTININNMVNFNDPILQSHRSINLMTQAYKELEIVNKIIAKHQSIDLSMNHLHQANQYILEILGQSKEYNFVDNLFRNFCIGK